VLLHSLFFEINTSCESLLSAMGTFSCVADWQKAVIAFGGSKVGFVRIAAVRVLSD